MKRRKVWLSVLLDMPCSMLPCTVFLSYVTYTAWAWWWI